MHKRNLLDYDSSVGISYLFDSIGRNTKDDDLNLREHETRTPLPSANNSAIRQFGGSLVTGRSPYRRKNVHILSMGERLGEAILYGGRQSSGLVNRAVRLPTLPWKLREDVTRSPKQGYQWAHKRTCVFQK